MEINFKPEKQLVFADRDKISQVVINLISNALKYTLKGGTVEVCVKGTKEIAELIVKDTGQGISAEDLPYIRIYLNDSIELINLVLD